MKIGLHDADKNGFPNFALMKISAYHKLVGDEVEWWNPMEHFDKVYSSKVFTFTPEEVIYCEDVMFCDEWERFTQSNGYCHKASQRVEVKGC